MVGVVIMLAALLFGYDQGVIAGALDGIKQDFTVGTTLSEIITSCVTLGAFGGALAAGLLADRYGRRRTILVAAGLFTIGAAVEAFAPPSSPLLTSVGASCRSTNWRSRSASSSPTPSTRP